MWLTRAALLGAVLVMLTDCATAAPASGAAQDDGKSGPDPGSVGMCADARVTGTAFARDEKQTVATVKRLYSPKCRKTYVYLGLRESYWAATRRNDLELGVGWPLREDPHHGNVDYDPPMGQDGMPYTRQTSSREFWFRSSAPHSCTSVNAYVQRNDDTPASFARLDFGCRHTTLDDWWPSVSGDE